jgi:transitional endoplasmic reticulum ATPase
MPASFATFTRLKDKGLAALREGDHLAARPYLLQAAECMIELAEETPDPQQRADQEAYARELLELARDCDRRARAGPGGGAAVRDRSRDGGDEDESQAADWIVREKPTITFEDIAGLEDVKQEIYLKMIYPFSHADLARHYGIDVGGGLLLYGPPGTGKTMIAKAVAHEVDATIFVVSPAQLMSKWVGEAEQNVRKLFSAAKAEPRSVIFIDEIEALVPARRSSDSTVMQRVVPQILQELEGFDRKEGRGLLFMGATNEPWSLDPAVMRPGRFDARVYVPLPDAAARFRLFEIHLGRRPLGDDVDLAELAERSAGYSGADIKAICARAASRKFIEALDGAPPAPITQADLLAVLATTPPSVSSRDVAKYEQWGQV